MDNQKSELIQYLVEQLCKIFKNNIPDISITATQIQELKQLGIDDGMLLSSLFDSVISEIYNKRIINNVS